MKKSSKTVLIVSTIAALVLSGGLFALLFAHHGTESYARFSGLYEDPSVTLKDLSVSSVTTELSQKLEYRKNYEQEGKTFAQGSFYFTDYATFDSASKALNRRIESVGADFFTDHALLGIYREGSFFSESVTGKAKYGNGTFSVTYYVEDEQPLSGKSEEKGVYYVDFFELSKGDEVNRVVLYDRLF